MLRRMKTPRRRNRTAAASLAATRARTRRHRRSTPVNARASGGPHRVRRVRDTVEIAGNRKRKRRAWSIIRLYPETATMSLDDRTADRQPDAHAVALGRVERIEQLVHALTLDADTSIPHRHAHMIPAF